MSAERFRERAGQILLEAGYDFDLAVPIAAALSEAVATERRECEETLLAMYEAGPQGRENPQPNAAWRQAWGSGICDGADAIRKRGS